MNTKLILATLVVALLTCVGYCCYSQSNAIDELSTRVDVVAQDTLRNDVNLKTVVDFLNQATRVAADTDTNNTTQEAN